MNELRCACADCSCTVDANALQRDGAIPSSVRIINLAGEPLKQSLVETLYQQIVNTHNMVLLTDAQGVIVHSLGDADFLEKPAHLPNDRS